MYRFDEIQTVHLEVSSKCNAACPMCLRNVQGGRTNPRLPLLELSLEQFQRIFPLEFLQRLKRLYMCGNYGDPATAKDTVDIFRYLRRVNPELRLEMFSNGGVRSKQWWTELAKPINHVRFSIDGLEDTNCLYRRNTHWEKIMTNAAAFIGAGGWAEWDFIVFRHNEHQVEEARELSRKMGFKKFHVKKSARFFSNVKLASKEQQPVLDEAGEQVFVLEKPKSPEYQNSAADHWKALEKTPGGIRDYVLNTPVNCKVAGEKSLYVAASGHVFPCCWTALQTFPWYYPEKAGDIWRLLELLPGGEGSINALENPIEEIVNGPFFHEIFPNSWEPSVAGIPRMRTCGKICGKQVRPFESQFQKPLGGEACAH